MAHDYKAKILQPDTPNIFKVMRGEKRMSVLLNCIHETRKGKTHRD
jgi:hypothetical protein